ncbi:MAG TPA: alkaline phosphatase family protein, partial [Candidatus Cybelea sp.]
PYEYVPHDETAPYFSMAKQYVLGDQMYPSNMDSSSYVSHQYIIAAQAGAALDYPETNWGCPGGVNDLIYTVTLQPPRKYGKMVTDCFDYQTTGDELDKAGDSWAFYAAALGVHRTGVKTCGSGRRSDGKYVEDGIWSAYQAVKHICYGADWDKDVFDPPQQFLTDVGDGQLRDVTWVTPYCKNSDHPGCNSDTGPSWVASLVNAVGESKFWDSTAIFVFWDDYGGLYDPDPPAYKDYDGLGIRVPLLIISPYAKKGWISHVHYEHGSILRFIEDRFHLAPLSASDHRAVNPMFDCFDFSQAPRRFVPIEAKYDTNFFLRQTPDFRPPDTD